MSDTEEEIKKYKVINTINCVRYSKIVIVRPTPFRSHIVSFCVTKTHIVSYYKP